MMTGLDLIASRMPGKADVAVILGSGLGAFADSLEEARAVSTSDLPGYPVSTVPGHAGRIVVGRVGKMRVMAFQGRIHLYEGYPPLIVVTPVRLAHRLGARVLIVTNASGSFTRRFKPGDLLLIDDHINLQFRNPLPALWPEGVRIPDTCFFYDPALCELAERAAMEEGIPLKRGVLAGMLGPTYETPAESRMLARIGADAGCMSTIPEVIMAVALGMRVLGISCVTNYAAGIADSPLDHDHVQRVAAETGARFCRLLRALLQRMKAKD
jgi:purine-nucleoside phosphorylase